MIADALTLAHDSNAMALWPHATQTATVPLTLDITASIENFTGAEAVQCDQLVVHLD